MAINNFLKDSSNILQSNCSLHADWKTAKNIIDLNSEFFRISVHINSTSTDWNIAVFPAPCPAFQKAGWGLGMKLIGML